MGNVLRSQITFQLLGFLHYMLNKYFDTVPGTMSYNTDVTTITQSITNKSKACSGAERSATHIFFPVSFEAVGSFCAAVKCCS